MRKITSYAFVSTVKYVKEYWVSALVSFIHQM